MAKKCKYQWPLNCSIQVAFEEILKVWHTGNFNVELKRPSLLDLRHRFLTRGPWTTRGLGGPKISSKNLLYPFESLGFRGPPMAIIDTIGVRERYF
jgi:hypothetical protein